MMSAENAPRWKTTGVWVVSLLLGLVFVGSGVTKLMGSQMHVDNFVRWGYPQWFRVLVGATEVIGALLLLVPCTSLFGAAALVVMMCGAVGTHIMNAEWAMVAPPFVLGVLAAMVGWARCARG